MSGMRVHRASSGGANALADLFGGFGVGAVSTNESQRDKAFRRIILEALLRVKRIGKKTGKDLEKVGFKKERGGYHYSMEVKRGPLVAKIYVSTNSQSIFDDGTPQWFFSVSKGTKTLVSINNHGPYGVYLVSDHGSEHDLTIARKTILKAGWKISG